MPSADGVLVAAIGLVLTGAGLPEVATLRNGDAAGTGFLAVTLAGETRPRAAVSWYEDGTPAGGNDALDVGPQFENQHDFPEREEEPQ